MVMMLLGNAMGPIPVRGDLDSAIASAFMDDRVYCVEVFDSASGCLVRRVMRSGVAR